MPNGRGLAAIASRMGLEMLFGAPTSAGWTPETIKGCSIMGPPKRGWAMLHAPLTSDAVTMGSQGAPLAPAGAGPKERITRN